MEDKVKCYELDFGDTNLISQNISDITEWIAWDMSILDGEETIEYVISVKMLTQTEINALPEWS